MNPVLGIKVEWTAGSRWDLVKVSGSFFHNNLLSDLTYVISPTNVARNRNPHVHNKDDISKEI